MKNLSEYLILEGDPLRQLNKEIGEIRRKLMAQYKSKDPQKNFGQKELQKLMDKWHYKRLIRNVKSPNGSFNRDTPQGW